MITVEAFRNKFQDIKSPEEALKIANDNGIVLTIVQLKNIMISVANLKGVVVPSGELPDSALENVAGGSSDDLPHAIL